MNNAEIEQSAIARFGSPRKLEDVSEEELRQAVASTDSPRPDFYTLKSFIRIMSFEKIGRIYGVTGAAVKSI